MYFIDEQHKKNFNHLSTMVFRSGRDPEYNSLAYILALPYIYSECSDDPMLHEFPLLWKYEYINKSYEGVDENGDTYIVLDFEVKEDKEGKAILSDRYTYLSSGYKKILHFAANLFNSSNDDFNLMDSLGTWDDRLLKCFYQALAIRTTREVPGLNIDIK